MSTPKTVTVGRVVLNWNPAGWCYLADTGNSVLMVSQTKHSGQFIGWTAVATADTSRVECFRIESAQAAASALTEKLRALRAALDEVL